MGNMQVGGFEQSAARPIDLSGWRLALATVSAALLGILFLVSGSWKLTDPFQWSQALTQFLVPSAVSMPFTVMLGIGEVFGAVLIVIPRYRKWGGWLIALMLVAFMVYIGLNYGALVGKDCSCFPLVKRSVGPGFFIGDAVMLAMSAAAVAWSPKPHGFRPLAVILGIVTVFAGVSYGVSATHQTGLKAPDSITVDGKEYSLQTGKVFLFFYDPECMHCDAAARRMSKLKWGGTQVVSIPTRVPQFAASFLKDTGLKAGTSPDTVKLREIFKFVDPPYGVVLEGGRQKATVVNFEESEPAKTLRPLGYIE